MKKLGAVIVMAVFISAPCSKAKAEMIWSDGFESGDFSAWTSVGGNWDTSGGNVHSGSKRAQIFGPYALDGDVLLLTQSLSGYENITLEYWARVYDGLESNDTLFIEWSPDGSSWNTVSAYINAPASTDWHNVSLLLPATADDNALFQFRIRSRLNNASDCIYFDDIILSGDLIPEPSSIITLAPFLFGLILCRSKKII